MPYEKITLTGAGDRARTKSLLTGINRLIADLPEQYALVVDASQADQGADTAATVKHFVDDIGTSKSATIIFIHSGASNTTTYTFSTDETIPSNFRVIVENGARLDGSSTLTINGPFEAGLYQVFGSSITVSFGAGAVSKAYAAWWGLTPGNNTAADVDRLAVATDGIPVYWANGTYTFTSDITLTDAVDVHWKSLDHTTLKYDPGSHDDDEFIIFKGSVFCEDITFDGNSEVAKVVSLRYHSTDTIDFERCIFKNGTQDTYTAPSPGMSAGILTYGKCARFRLKDCETLNIDALNTEGDDRPTSRGWNHSTTGYNTNDGSPVIAIVDECLFDGIIASNASWGVGTIDCDAIVWRTEDDDFYSSLTVSNSMFRSYQKRAIKLNLGHNARIIDNTFYAKSGEPAYHTISFQGTEAAGLNESSEGFCSRNTFYCEDATAIPNEFVKTSASGVSIVDNRFFLPAGSPDYIFAISQADDEKLTGLVIRDNTVIAEDGINYFIKSGLTTVATAAGAYAVGLHGAIVQGNTISDINTHMFYLTKTGDDYTFQEFIVSDNTIHAGDTDQYGVTFGESNTDISFVSHGIEGHKYLRKSSPDGDETYSISFDLSQVQFAKVTVTYVIHRAETDEALHIQRLFLSNDAGSVEDADIFIHRATKAECGTISATVAAAVVTVAKTAGTSNAYGMLKIIVESSEELYFY